MKLSDEQLERFTTMLEAEFTDDAGDMVRGYLGVTSDADAFKHSDYDVLFNQAMHAIVVSYLAVDPINDNPFTESTNETV